MAGRIVVFGATGYTGRLVSEALVEREQEPVLAGRDAGRLRSLAGELGGLETAVAEAARPESVAALVERGDVLVSTVGPFARWGGPALDAAIGAGAHYIDSTGEPSFIRRVFEREGPRAEQAGCGLLTAMGYDWVPGNLAGALALRDAGDTAVAVRIGYFFRGRGVASEGSSGGTRASAMGVFLDPQYRRHAGGIVDERSSSRVHSFEVGGRSRPAVASGSSEAFALPRIHSGLRDVDVYVGWFGGATKTMAFASRGMSALLRVPGAKSAARAGVARFVKGSTGGPSPEYRERTGSEIVAEALGPAGEVLAGVRVTGVNAYTFTGAMIAWAAEQAAVGGLQGSGALGPVDGFGLDALEQGVAEAGIRRVD